MMLGALHAEWTKVRTTRGIGWLLFAAAALTIAVGVTAAGATTCPAGHCGDDPARISLTGFYLGQAIIAVAGVLTMSDEYSTGMIRVTLAAMPRRTGVLAAKAIILAALVLPAAVVAVAGSLLGGRLTLPSNGIGPAQGYPALSLADPAVLRAAVGSVLYLILIALLGLGVATLVRDPAAAIGLVLGLLYLFPIIAAVAGNPRLAQHIQQLGPMTAGLAIQASTNLSALPIGPWSGLGVLAAWAAAALLAGGIVLRRRDA